MSTNTEERVDTSDLEALDDANRHARCTYCGPVDVDPFVPFEALCGVRAVYRDNSVGRSEVPPNACEKCKALWHQPCARCGR